MFLILLRNIEWNDAMRLHVVPEFNKLNTSFVWTDICLFFQEIPQNNIFPKTVSQEIQQKECGPILFDSTKSKRPITSRLIRPEICLRAHSFAT